MADTIAPLVVAKETWTDVYAGTSIAVGTALVCTIFQTKFPVYGCIAASTPDGTKTIPLQEIGSSFKVASGETGFWVYSDEPFKLAVQAQ